ncbi:50S ribosomal protein L29 [Candidatus Woesearchaeota archaeon]|nr:50S ribosomal protein L29 [Candidatus Woesearchaeota archaeon]
MRSKDLLAMSEKEIADKLGEIQLELIKENAQISTGTNPKSPGRIKQLKKTIAKIKTIQYNTKETTQA